MKLLIFLVAAAIVAILFLTAPQAKIADPSRIQAAPKLFNPSIGLDPTIVGGMHELADVLGENAHDVVLALRRMFVTYAAIQEAVASGVRLPNDARTWLTGEAA